MKKLKTYRLAVSLEFPKIHKRAGEFTRFEGKIQNNFENVPAMEIEEPMWKLHTIRANYGLWEKRIDEVNAGNAVLVLYEWTGKPYRSKTRELFRFDKDSGIGVQLLEFAGDIYCPYTDNYIGCGSERDIDVKELAKNDGLSFSDWYSWFESYDINKPMAIIHFTKFRY